MVAFGDRLYWLSRRLGFTDNSAFARHLDLPRPRVQQLLGLLYPPDLPTLERLAAKCGVPVETLLVGVRTTKLPKPPDDALDALLGHARPPSKAHPTPRAG